MCYQRCRPGKGKESSGLSLRSHIHTSHFTYADGGRPYCHVSVIQINISRGNKGQFLFVRVPWKHPVGVGLGGG